MPEARKGAMTDQVAVGQCVVVAAAKCLVGVLKRQAGAAQSPVVVCSSAEAELQTAAPR